MFSYYLLVMVAVTMFGSQFFTNKIATEKMGSGLFTVMWYNLCGGIVSFIIFIMMTGFKFEYTPFTLLMACLSVLNGKLFSYCSFKSLGIVSTLLSYFKKDKPKLKNWIAVILSFIGIMALTFIQIPVFS